MILETFGFLCRSRCSTTEVPTKSLNANSWSELSNTGVDLLPKFLFYQTLSRKPIESEGGEPSAHVLEGLRGPSRQLPVSVAFNGTSQDRIAVTLREQWQPELPFGIPRKKRQESRLLAFTIERTTFFSSWKYLIRSSAAKSSRCRCELCPFCESSHLGPVSAKVCFQGFCLPILCLVTSKTLVACPGTLAKCTTAQPDNVKRYRPSFRLWGDIRASPPLHH